MYYNFDEIVYREGTNSVKYDLGRKIFKNENIIPMWVADMDFKTPDFVINAISQRLNHEVLGYTVIPQSFYTSIVKWTLKRHNWKIKSDWISFSPGVVPALSLLVLAFTNPGDGIIVQPPVYFPFFSTIEKHNRKLISNPLKFENGGYTVDFIDLERKMTHAKMMFLCNPHNPTGNAWSQQVLKQIGEMCLKHNVLLISDEIHADLIFPGNRHNPTASLSDSISANTITCMSPSKTFNLAGLSTAYLITENPKLRSQYEETLDRVHVGAGNIFGFIAAEAAYEYGAEWLNQLMEYLAGNLRFLVEYLSNNIPRIKVIPAQATYLIWLDCHGLGMPSEELRRFMIFDAGLGMNDGLQFGSEGEGFQRINIGCPRQILHQALVKLHIAVDKYFQK